MSGPCAGSGGRLRGREAAAETRGQAERSDRKETARAGSTTAWRAYPILGKYVHQAGEPAGFVPPAVCGAAWAWPRGLAQPAPPRGWGLCSFTSARPAAGGPRTCGGLGGLCFDLFCPGGRIELPAEGGAPGPATGQVLPPVGLVVLSLLCSPFIHCRCEEALGALFHGPETCSPPPFVRQPRCPGRGRLVPKQRALLSCQRHLSPVQLVGSLLCFGLLSQAPGHATFHLLCFTLAKRSMASARLIDPGIYLFTQLLRSSLYYFCSFPAALAADF